jgi:hypothetical protein
MAVAWIRLIGINHPWSTQLEMVAAAAGRLWGVSSSSALARRENGVDFVY